MKEKLQHFMVGRYGTDSLNNFMMGTGLAFIVLSLVFRSQFLSWLVFVVLILMYVRMFSKNVQKRYAENQKFLELKQKAMNLFRGSKTRIEQSKEYHIYKCPKCKQKIRIPRGKGKISITCPKCGESFIKKS